MPEQANPTDTGLVCPTCGYNLTALTSTVCPECGATFIITDRSGLPRPKPPSAFARFASILYYAGTALIILSWVDVVSPGVGWIGFAIAFSVWLLSHFTRR